MKSVYRKYFTIGIIFWAVCFIILLFSYLIVLAPQERLRLMTERKLAETTRLAQSARQAAEESNKNKLLEQLSDSDRRLRDFVVDQEKARNLTFDIGRLSSDVKLNSFSSISTAGEGTLKTDNYKYIVTRQISVNFNSGFTKFAMFLNALERSRPVIFIDSFSITRSAESDSGNKVDMKLAVLVEKEAKTKGVDG
jgi:Tfp pilus assembly protein PilO